MSTEQLLPYEIAFAHHEDKFIMHVVSYHQCQRPYFFFQSFSVNFKWTSVNIEQGFNLELVFLCPDS